MKDLALILVIMMAVGGLLFLSLIQMATRNLQSILIVSFMMGLLTAFIGTMVIFTLQEFDVTMLFKIIFMSQVISTMLTFIIRVQNCMQPR